MNTFIAADSNFILVNFILVNFALVNFSLMNVFPKLLC